MTSTEKSKNELKSWLTTLFKNEDYENVEFAILGNSGKGDGYIGDIVFVEIHGTSRNGKTKKYDLVLKCSKSSQKLRDASPVKEAFYSEIYFYDVIFPTFLQFQRDRNISKPFQKVPKCYGTLSTGNMEMIALENLKSKGFILWERTKPLTRKHIDMVIKQYAKFHAVSIAMKDQEPEKFQQLVNGLDDVLRKFAKTTQMISAFEDTIQEIHDLLQDELKNDILEKWLQLKFKISPFYDTILDKLEGLKLITHGDCWSNNFLHYHKDNEPVDFVILDWQLMTYSSPILDLSYFLFSCISKQDINDLDAILHFYHKNLSEHLEKLGSAAHVLYPLNQHLEEWRKYCKFGIIMSTIIHKFSLSEESEVPDMTEAAEKGEDISKVFSQPIKNTTDYKKRMQYIVTYVVENNLI